MVNKGSFFQRLKQRWGSGSGVRVETSDAARARASTKPGVDAARAESGSGSGSGNGSGTGSGNGSRGVSTSFAPADARSSRKMSEREEALLALGSHFHVLTSLLRGSQARTDEKLQKLVDVTTSLGSLPAVSQQQLETLKALSVQMERQNQLGEQLSTTMTRLPNLLQSVETALQRAAATDERTAATVKEFQSTMDRIHTSMDTMVQHSGEQAKAAKELSEKRTEEMAGIAKHHQDAVGELKRATDEGLQSLRRTHEDQSNRLQRVVAEHAGWNRAVLVGIGLVVIGIGSVIVLQLVG
jgi:methyl-accepting chemotaxis protein